MTTVPRVVIGQSLRVHAVLGVDLTGASAVTLGYRFSDSPSGSIAAVVDTAATGEIHADIPAATLSKAGDWYFWAEATTAEALVVKTYASAVKVLAQGMPVA